VQGWQHAASTHVKQVADWWGRWPDANVGVATGEGSGIVVLDVDPAKGGEASLAVLEAEHGRLPTTARQLTGGEGLHYLFAHPGVAVRNDAESKLGPGLDVRGDGGQIVVAPSRHVSGSRYEWLALPGPGEGLPELPAWLLETLREPEALAAARMMPPASRPAGGSGSSPYGVAALERETGDVARAPAGTRNHTLLRAAQNLFELVNGAELVESEARAALERAAAACGLDEQETAATIESAWRRMQGKARTAPPRPPTAAPGSGRGRALRAVPDDPAPAAGPPAGGEPPDDEPPPGEPPDDGAPPEDADPGDVDWDPTGRFEDTDTGNAKRLIAAHGGILRHVPQWGAWLIWDTQRWRRDTTGHIYRFATDVVEDLLLEASREPDDARRKRRVRFALESQNRNRIENLVSLARHRPGVPVEPIDLDADPWALNAVNGTIDLRTGELRAHRPKDLITKLVPVAYDPYARSEVWDQFLETATQGDQDLIYFLQRAVGYSLTGDTGEEVLFFVHGPGASGKSTFIDAVESCLGDYARRADFETFLARNQVGGPRGDIARLAGARFVDSVEVDEGKKLAEGLVKTITGGDVMTAAYKYKDEFEFRPQFKLWLAANHAPNVKHGDTAMWRRILRIPFEHVIPKPERDPQVKAALRDPQRAGPAVLTWAVTGCLAWQNYGLAVPSTVARATDEYRDDQDPLRDFLEDACVFETDSMCTAAELRRAYDTWANENGLRHTLSPKAFKEILEEHGAQPDRIRLHAKTTRIWRGIGLRIPDDPSALFTPPDHHERRDLR